MCLIGPNGSGKSTLIRAICQRITVDKGKIYFTGKVNKRIGWIPQEIAVYPTLSVLENLNYFASISDVPVSKQKEEVNQSLLICALQNRANDKVNNLSVGMKRRLNFAIGLLNNPDIILMDEPTSGVDPENRNKIWSLIAELKSKGSTILLTTQNLEEVEQICDRVAIINNGRIVEQGELNALTERVIGRFWTVSIDARKSVDSEINNNKVRIREKITSVENELPCIIDGIKHQGWLIDGIRVLPPNIHSVYFELTDQQQNKESFDEYKPL